MKISAHRGYWKTPDEKNDLNALTAALCRGWGIETDIRDYRGEIVISHNPADEKSPKLEDLLSAFNALEAKPYLALNVKADGLYLLLPDLLERFNIKPENYFLFDMSLPEQYIYIKRGYKVFTRSSEFEPQPVFMEHAQGVWLDQFTDCEHIVGSLDRFLNAGKEVCVVSPELHGREYKKMWKFLLERKEHQNLFLCTDKPDEAERFFK